MLSDTWGKTCHPLELNFTQMVVVFYLNFPESVEADGVEAAVQLMLHHHLNSHDFDVDSLDPCPVDHEQKCLE